MSTTKKASYISMELEWLSNKIIQLQEAIDKLLENPQDRYGPKEMPNGRVVQAIISSEEDQIKAGTAVLEKLAKMIQALEELREKEDKKLQLRGDKQVTGMMKRFAEGGESE